MRRSKALYLSGHHPTCCIHVAHFKPSEPVPRDHRGQTRMSRRRPQACSALFSRRAPEVSQCDRYRTLPPLSLATLHWFYFLYFWGLCSITDRGEYRIPYMDCFGCAGGLHRAGGASTPSDELLHGGYVRPTSHNFLQTYRGRIHD